MCPPSETQDLTVRARLSYLVRPRPKDWRGRRSGPRPHKPAFPGALAEGAARSQAMAHRAGSPEGACLERQLGALQIIHELDAVSSADASRPDPDGLGSRSDDDDLLSAQDIEQGDKRTDESADQERYGSYTLTGELEGPEPHNRRQDQQDRI